MAGGLVEPLEEPQAEDMLLSRRGEAGVCLLWTFCWSILNIEEMENWDRSQNALFPASVRCQIVLKPSHQLTTAL